MNETCLDWLLRIVVETNDETTRAKASHNIAAYKQFVAHAKSLGYAGSVSLWDVVGGTARTPRVGADGSLLTFLNVGGEHGQSFAFFVFAEAAQYVHGEHFATRAPLAAYYTHIAPRAVRSAPRVVKLRKPTQPPRGDSAYEAPSWEYELLYVPPGSKTSRDAP